MDNESRIVKKSNSIVSSRMKNFSLIQVKIFNLAISELTTESKEGDILKFQAIDVLKAIGLGEKNHEELRKSTLDMIRGVEIKNPNGGISQVPIFTEIEYLPGGTIQIEFHKKVLPLLVQAKTEYTKYYFENIQRLKSMYSIRIYELCKQYQNTDNGYREFKIDDFKFLLDISDKLYPRYFDFKKRVLTSSISEINTKTDIDISLEEIKKGRLVEKIRFYIVPKNGNTYKKIEEKQPSFSEEIEKLTPAGFKLVEDYLISKSVAIEIQVLATSDEHLFYTIKEFNKKLDSQIKRGNKPDNLPRYAEISLREMIPTILISGAVEKEREAIEKNRIKLEENNIKTKNEDILNQKKEDLKNKFKDFCNNPDLVEILKNTNITELLNIPLDSEITFEKHAKEEALRLFNCSIQELTKGDIYSILTNQIRMQGSEKNYTVSNFINLKNYLKYTLKSLFMND